MYQFFLECNVIIIIIFNFYEETYIKKCRNKIIFERVWKKLYSLYIKILLDIVGTLFNFDIILIQKISTNIEKYANKLITQLYLTFVKLSKYDPLHWQLFSQYKMSKKIINLCEKWEQ